MSGPQAENYHLTRTLPGRGGELDARCACLASRLGTPYRLGDLVPGPGSPGRASAVPAKVAMGGRLPDLHSARWHPLPTRRQGVDARRDPLSRSSRCPTRITMEIYTQVPDKVPGTHSGG
jgi:hypothetical protein